MLIQIQILKKEHGLKEKVKLNLGCGGILFKDYINIDFDTLDDIKNDIQILKLKIIINFYKVMY